MSLLFTCCLLDRGSNVLSLCSQLIAHGKKRDIWVVFSTFGINMVVNIAVLQVLQYLQVRFAIQSLDSIVSCEVPVLWVDVACYSTSERVY